MDFIIITATGKCFGPYTDASAEYPSPPITDALDRLPDCEKPVQIHPLRSPYGIPVKPRD